MANFSQKKNNKHSQVLLVFRKNPRKWDYWWSSVLKTCTALNVGIFERIYCFDEVFLMALSSAEQLFIETPLYRRFCIMITYTISSNLFKKGSLQCYRLNNFPSFRNGHWRCSVRKGVLEILKNPQENICGKVSFLIKLQAEATAPDLSRVFSWRFLVYFISTETWDEKRKIPWWNPNIYFEYRFVWRQGFQIKIWQMVIWSVNVFKENLMLQFSWLEDFH